MALSNSNNYTSIQSLPDDQKFNGENFVTTAATAINDLHPSILEFEIRESVAYLTLWNNIKNLDGLGIPHGLTSKDLWKYLKDEFEQTSEISRQRKEDSLRASRYNEGMKIAGEGGYAEKMRVLWKEANDCGANISSTQFITIFLDSFPRTTTWLVITGSLMGEKRMNVIVSQLDEYYLHMGGGGLPSSSLVPAPDKISVLQAKIKQLEVALAANNSPKGPRDPSLVCTNPNCKGKGHLIESCWKLGGGKQGQYPKWWKGKRDAPILSQSANFTTTQGFSPSSIRTEYVQDIYCPFWDSREFV
ncbi:hypothetical protein L218DRAFT_981784 [Marasmius fiardii PR-910]|nr:hypothetical protein L218DRAFT_981784 [Marasmius fiardii PR-910]